jgi:hypothetical protein
MSYRLAARDASRRHMRLALLIVLAPLTWAANPALASAQAGGVSDAQDTLGVLVGTLSGFDDGQPIGYATVSLSGAAGALFADSKGTFRLTRLVPGSYHLRTRQIGYAPLDTTLVVAAGPEETTVALRMHRVAVRLTGVAVEGHRGRGCVTTGVPDSTVNPTLATVFAQVRENVDRFRLLLDEYPFEYAREERRAFELDPGGDSTLSVDTVSYESRSQRPYQVGGIIYTDYDAIGRPRHVMYLPTFRDFADPAFLKAHCFTYGGTGPLGGAHGARAIRVDFRPARSIESPDVEGSIYLDAERFIVRRAVFRMTKPERADPPVLGLSATTTFRELVPLVPVFDSVETRQPFPTRTVASPRTLGGPRETISQQVVERDRLLNFGFERKGLGEQGEHDSAPARQVAAAPAAAAAPPPVRGLVGRVIEANGTPVAGATLGLYGVADTTVTSDSGGFAVADAPVGAHTLWVRRLGFEGMRVPVTVSREHPRPIVVTLARAVPVLATVVTTAEARSAMKDVGLDRRMRAGQGQFLTYEQIERRHAASVSQLLQGMRGIRILQRPWEFETSVVGTRGAGSCVSYSVDGIPQSVVSDHDIDNITDPSEIGAIEVYSSAERPPGMGGLEERPLPDPRQALPVIDTAGQQCVLVVIWTRSKLGLGPRATPTQAAGIHGTRARPVFPAGSLCEVRPAEDTIEVALYAALQAEGAPAVPDTAWTHYERRVLDAIRGAFVMPSDLPISVFGYAFAMAGGAAGVPTSRVPSLAVAPGLSGVIAFTLDSVGALGKVRVAASSLSGAADTSVLAALTDAEAAHTFPRATGELTTGSAGVRRFDLVLSTGQPAVGGPAVVLGRLLEPMWPLGRRSSIAQGTQPSLAPDGVLRFGADSVTLEFVVDEAGQAALSTVRELGGSNRTDGSRQSQRDFLARVLRALPKFRFTPALIGACPVRQLVRQGFAYSQKLGDTGPGE